MNFKSFYISTGGSAKKGIFNFGENPSSSEKKKLMQPTRGIENGKK